MEYQNQELLAELHRTVSMGMEAARQVSPRITDPGLRREVECQQSSYLKLLNRTESLLSKENSLPQPDGWAQKAMLWGSVQLNTLADSSNEHLAEMMINGTNMGIVEVTKKLNGLSDSDGEAKRLAKEYLSGEERHIEELKRYL